MDNYNDYVAKRLKLERKKKYRSGEDFAKAKLTGIINHRDYYRIEKGDKVPNQKLLHQILSALDLPADYFNDYALIGFANMDLTLKEFIEDIDIDSLSASQKEEYNEINKNTASFRKDCDIISETYNLAFHVTYKLTGVTYEASPVDLSKPFHQPAIKNQIIAASDIAKVFSGGLYAIRHNNTYFFGEIDKIVLTNKDTKKKRTFANINILHNFAIIAKEVSDHIKRENTAAILKLSQINKLD